MPKRRLTYVLAAGMVLAAEMVLAADSAPRAIQPADPDLIPEGRRLLEYMVAQRGGRIVSGCVNSGPGSGPFEAWILASGREPALRGFNIAGFHPRCDNRTIRGRKGRDAASRRAGVSSSPHKSL